MKLIDTHCHLNDQALYQDLDNVISRALQTGIEKMVVIGWDKESSETAIKIAEQYPFIYACVGFHPENLDGVDEKTLYEVLNLSKHPKVVGIGEIGLDYHWEKDPAKREIQKEFFIKQIEYANEHGLPISIHSREAFQDTLEILKNHKPQHCNGAKRRALSATIYECLYGQGAPRPLRHRRQRARGDAAERGAHPACHRHPPAVRHRHHRGAGPFQAPHLPRISARTDSTGAL